MPATLRLSSKLCLVALLFAIAARLAPVSAAPLIRTIYVTVTDKSGAKVPDLTAADFAVKEGGKAVEIVKVEPATGRMHLAIMIEEPLAPDASVRQAMLDFIRRVQPSAEISLISVGLRNTTVVGYTQSIDALVGALNQFTVSPQPTSNLMESVLAIGKEFEKQQPDRPVIVAIVVSGGQAGGASADEVLSQLRQSGAGLYTVTLGGAQGAGSGQLGSMGDESGREQVLGDGPKQSGGRRVEVSVTSQTSKALQQVADDLLSQYVIKYALPSGVKPDKRVNVSLSRKGLAFRAPSGIPDR